MKNLLKTAGIPLWVTIFALIVLLMGCVTGLMIMFGPGPDPLLSSAMKFSLGGRQLGLGLAVGVAVLLKSPTAYIAVFVGGLGRDLADLMAELSKLEPSMGKIVPITAFFIIGAMGIFYANKARNL